MGKIYAKAIVAGARTYASIRDTWKAATLAALEDMVKQGTLTEERFAEIVGEE